MRLFITILSISTLVSLRAQADDSQSGIMDRLVSARCKVALCPGDGWFGLEPLIELPGGASVVVHGGDTGLRDYLTTHPFSAAFKAGARLWFFKDYVGLGVYYSSQAYRPADDPSFRMRGSTFEYSATQIRRPYPGVALTAFAGALWVGLDVDELRNADTDSLRDPDYPRNHAIDRAVSVTFGIAPASILRGLLGLATTPATSTTPAPQGEKPPARGVSNTSGAGSDANGSPSESEATSLAQPERPAEPSEQATPQPDAQPAPAASPPEDSTTNPAAPLE